jgi:hypothetical protein
MQARGGVTPAIRHNSEFDGLAFPSAIGLPVSGQPPKISSERVLWNGRSYQAPARGAPETAFTGIDSRPKKGNEGVDHIL